MIRVLFICHGNICRSPMAEFIFKDMVEKAGLIQEFHIESRATSTEEIWGSQGNPMYPPAQAELRKHGIGNTPYTRFTEKRAQQVSKRDYAEYDYLLCADTANIKNTLRIVGPDQEEKIHLLMDFADEKNWKNGIINNSGRSIADPWYTGNFVTTYDNIVEGLNGFMKYLRCRS